MCCLIPSEASTFLTSVFDVSSKNPSIKYMKVATGGRNYTRTPPYRLQLLLLLDQELQHQIDICQVQVLLVRIQSILEYLPPRPILDTRGGF